MADISIEGIVAYARHRDGLPPPEMRAAIRRAAGLSLRQLAVALGVTPSAVRLWERGRRTPKGPHLVGYATLLKELAER